MFWYVHRFKEYQKTAVVASERGTMERHLSVTEAARTLGVHPQTVYQLIWGGRLPGVIRVGRAIRIPESALGSFPEYAPPEASGQ